MANIPNIRFKGFTEDWEQRKLGEMCNFINGDRSNNYPNATDFQERGIPFVGSDSLGMTYINKNKLRFITFEKYFQMKGLKIQKGDILYTLRGAGFGKCSISDFSEGTVASSLVGIRCSEELLKPPFLIQWLNSANAESEKKKAVNGSTAQNISVEDMKLYVICTPTMEEQEKISEYLLNLDNLITFHQRKCDETKELKKYMLQKMFPQNGKKIPEIRFAGFTDDWEQRKLAEITERVTRKNQDLESELPLTISAQYGLIDQNEFFDKRVASKDVSGYYLVRNGEFAYNKSTSSDAPWGAVKRLDRYEKGVLSTLYIVFRIVDESKIDSDYIVTYYDTDLWHKGIQAIAAEGARNHGLLNITPLDFFETTLMVPQDIDEQKRIGKYFKMLDNLITLHQRKCDELKEVKKFMLQNMFPQKG